MAYRLILTIHSNGIPGQVLDDLNESLHAYYRKQGHPAYRWWGRSFWHIEIEPVPEEGECEECEE
jgi:hypothetical protein